MRWAERRRVGTLLALALLLAGFDETAPRLVNPSPKRRGSAQPPPSQRPPVELFPSEVLRRHARAPPASEPSSEPSPEDDRTRIERRLQAEFDTFAATDRVRNGLVDPYFVRVQRQWLSGWHPPDALLGGKGGFAGLRNLFGATMRAGSTYGRTGAPSIGSGTSLAPVAHEEQRPAGGTSGFDAAGFMAHWNAGDFAPEQFVLLVAVAQDDRGQVVDARLVRSCGSPAIDRSALELIARERLPVPPSHGLGLGAARLQTVWRFDARVVTGSCGLPADPTGASGGVGVLPGLVCGGRFGGDEGATGDRPFQSRFATRITLEQVIGGEVRPVRPR